MTNITDATRYSLEFRIISEILRSRSLNDALSVGLKPEHFRSPEPRTVYRFIQDHWYHPQTRNEVPLMETIMSRFPSFALSEDNCNISQFRSMIHELKLQALGTDIRALANLMLEMNEEDPYQALQLLKARLYGVDFKFEPTKGFGIEEVVEGAKALYHGALDGSLRGIPWTWDCLTSDTGGKKGGDLVVFYARMKSMKTWILLKCAVDDYLQYNQRVYIWSKEMSEDKIKLRLASLLAKVDYQLMKNGTLPKRIADRAFKELDRIGLDGLMNRTNEQIRDGGILGTRDLIVQCGPRAPRDTTGLKAAIADFKPDVVYIDSFYHLRVNHVSDGAQLWHKITVLTEELKEMAMDLNVPIIVAAQANRLGDKTLGSNLSEVAGADAIAREADLIMRIVKKTGGTPLHEHDYEGEVERERSGRNRRSLLLKKSSDQPADRPPRVGAELVIVLGGNREGVLEAFSIHAIPGYNFEVTDTCFDMSNIHNWAGQGQEEMQTSMIKSINSKKSDYSPKNFRR